MTEVESPAAVDAQRAEARFPHVIGWWLGADAGALERLDVPAGEAKYFQIHDAIEEVIRNTLRQTPSLQMPGLLLLQLGPPPDRADIPDEVRHEVDARVSTCVRGVLSSRTVQVCELLAPEFGDYRSRWQFLPEPRRTAQPDAHGPRLAQERAKEHSGGRMPETEKEQPSDQPQHGAPAGGLPSPRAPEVPKEIRRALDTLARLTESCARFDTTADFLQARAALAEMIEEFQVGVLAPLAEGPLNKALGAFSADTREEKSVLAKWLNTALGSIWLAVAHPVTGDAATVVAGSGGDKAKGRFDFRSPGVKKSRQSLPKPLKLAAAKPEAKPGRVSAAKAERHLQSPKTKPKKPGR